VTSVGDAVVCSFGFNCLCMVRFAIETRLSLHDCVCRALGLRDKPI
jgi:hypothetical protein